MSDLSVYLSSAIIATFPQDVPLKEAAELRFLQAVALVESGANPRALGDKNRARGAWQMHKAAWIDSYKWRKAAGERAWNWGDWQNVTAQREMAQGYIQYLQHNFSLHKIEPNPARIYIAYNIGFSGYIKESESAVKSARWNRAVEAASRVENIFYNAK
jgi:hypothetical protein